MLFGILKRCSRCKICIAQTICSNTDCRKVLAVFRMTSALYSGNITINRTMQIEINDDLQLVRPPVNVYRSFLCAIIALNALLYAFAKRVLLCSVIYLYPQRVIFWSSAFRRRGVSIPPRPSFGCKNKADHCPVAAPRLLECLTFYEVKPCFKLISIRFPCFFVPVYIRFCRVPIAAQLCSDGCNNATRTLDSSKYLAFFVVLFLSAAHAYPFGISDL